jgi:hypothetical protein
MAAVRWPNYAACLWALAFAAPHVWWAMGSPYGYPGGEASYRVMMTSWWRYANDVLVVLLSILGALVALTLVRSASESKRRRVSRVLAWIACVVLSLRGIAGLIVDGTSDPVWWPAFLTGGVLFGLVARRAAKAPRAM